jgi:hypothetical protein
MNNKIREDLLVTALEGGSNYWYHLPDLSMVEKYRKPSQSMSERIWLAVRKGCVIPVHDCENEDEMLGEISKERIAEGEEAMKENSPEHWENANDDNWDAETADVWFQYVVLNELTYG